MKLSTVENSYVNTLEKWQKQVKIENGKLVNQNGEEIKYIGRIKDSSTNPNDKISSSTNINDFFDAFEIKVTGNYIELIHPYVKGFRKKVDYNTFLMIFLDNQLEPWTEKQFRQAETNYSTVPKAGPNKSRFYYSIGNLIFSFKGVKISCSLF